MQATWGDREGDDNGTGGDVNGVDIRSEWSIRGRAGYLMSPNFLLYGPVGYVTMDVDATAPIDGAVNESINGWTYGIGGEWRSTIVGAACSSGAPTKWMRHASRSRAMAMTKA